MIVSFLWIVTKESIQRIIAKNEEKSINKKEKIIETVSFEKNGNNHKELFVGNLNFLTSENTLWKHFGKFGKVDDVKLVTDRQTGESKGIAFVAFSTRKEAINALENCKDLDGRTLNLSWSNDKEGSRKHGNNNNVGGNFKENQGNQLRKHSGPAYIIFVGNLGYRTTEETLKKFFSRAGNVLSVRIAKHYDGRAKGFCHVDFDSQDAVNKAMAMSGQELDGREIRVDKTEPIKSYEEFKNLKEDDWGSLRVGRGVDRGGFRGDKSEVRGAFRGRGRGFY